MKLYYVTTNGDDFVLAESNDGRTCELGVYDFFDDEASPYRHGMNDAIASNDQHLMQKICMNFLREIAENNDFDDLFENWTAGEPDDFPHPPANEIIDKTCVVVAEYEV